MPRSDCPLCFGKGLLFENPVQLQVTYQSNYKNPYNGSNGMFDLGTTIATPQITENGIENGISFRDRLTVTNMYLSQSLTFNITERRVASGVYIPYLLANGINGFDRVITLSDDNTLKELTANKDFTFNTKTNKMFFSDEFIGKNISMNISVVPRYYVTDIAKEIRSYQIKNVELKKMVEGDGNKNLTNYLKNNYITQENGITYYRAPKKLILRREDLYISMADFDSNSNAKESKYIDPKHYDGDSISSLLGGENN